MILIGLLLVLAVVAGILALLVAVFLRRVVPPNMTHIVQSKNKSTAYGRNEPAGNAYYAWPQWVPRWGVTIAKFPVSNFQINLTDYEAYDVNRLPFRVDIAAFFRVEEAEIGAQRMATFEELQKQLTAVVQGAVRRVLAINKLEDILQSRGTLGMDFTNEVNKDLSSGWGVTTVKTIEFMDIRDSTKGQVIHDIMAKEQSRISKESRMIVAENTRAAEVAEVDAQREVDINKQLARQQVGLSTAQTDQQVGIAQEKANQQIQAEAAVTKQREMDVARVGEQLRADIDRNVLITKAEASQRTTIIDSEAEAAQLRIKAEGNKNAEILSAEAVKAKTVLVAEGDLTKALKNAEGMRAEGEAKGAAEKAILMAPVEAQITLANKISGDDVYQNYLLTVKRYEVTGDIGKAMASALAEADLKVIANGGGADMNGQVLSGTAGLLNMFNPRGGTDLSGFLTALSQTDEGKALLGRVVGGTAPEAAS